MLTLMNEKRTIIKIVVYINIINKNQVHSRPWMGSTILERLEQFLIDDVLLNIIISCETE